MLGSTRYNDIANAVRFKLVERGREACVFHDGTSGWCRSMMAVESAAWVVLVSERFSSPANKQVPWRSRAGLSARGLRTFRDDTHTRSSSLDFCHSRFAATVIPYLRGDNIVTTGPPGL
jgi:hypothetical protein